jgi:hypothetical protein
MEAKILIPLIGVVVGWILSEASTVIRIHREERRTINRTITSLLELRNEIRRAHFLLKGGRELHEDNFTEAERKRLMETHLRPLDSNIHSKVVEELSGISPILAVKLRHMLDSQKAFLESELTSIEQTPDLYNLMLETFDLLYVKGSEKLRGIVIALALKQGVFTFIRIVWYFWRESSEQESWGGVAKSLVKKFNPENEKPNNTN